MARSYKRLTAAAVESIKKPGLHADGMGLYLQVGPGSAKSWVFRYMKDGKQRKIGLGSARVRTLAEAREIAHDNQRKLLVGIDPLQEQQQLEQVRKLEQARLLTFEDAAGKYIESHKDGWKNAVHAAQWPATLKAYVYPHFGSISVADIDVALVLKALQPIWTEKPETASRVRGRIEKVLDWAKARGYRAGENPARWKGHLDHLLPRKSKVSTVKHHPALPYSEMSGFMSSLRELDGVSPRALEFAILTATRTGETVGAKWDEFDFAQKMWTIPPERMKAGREHRVPLTERLIRILDGLPRDAASDFVFIGEKKGKSLSNMALLMTLRRMKRDDLTTHGFRSTFRDWGAEQTAYPNELLEMALAHTVSDKVEAAYRRGDLLEKRRRLMNDWGKFCQASSPTTNNVTPIRDATNV